MPTTHDVSSGWFWLALVLALPLAIAVHELGHAALGALEIGRAHV